jgi:diguanylate cyclase (GGDEF)-like protein
MDYQPAKDDSGFLFNLVLKEFNYILDVDLTEKEIVQSISNIQEIPDGLTYEFFITKFGENVPLSHKTAARNFMHSITTAVATGNLTPQFVELRFTDIQDNIKSKWSAIKCIYRRDVHGHLHGYIISRDITMEKENEVRVIKSGQRDPLTNLINRFGFDYLSGSVLAHAIIYQQKLALFFIDIDYFKQINDTHGHQFGDQVLKVVADKIRKQFKETDIICRCGGDEFIVLMDGNPSADTACRKAADLCKAVSMIEFPSAYVKVSISIGISLFPEHSEDPDMLEHLADLALYEAKAKGKNQYRLFSEESTNSLELSYQQERQGQKNGSSTALLELVLDDLAIGIVVIEAESYRVLYINEKARELFKIDRNTNICGQLCFQSLKGNSGPCPDCNLTGWKNKKICRNSRTLYQQIKTKMIDWNGQISYIQYISASLPTDGPKTGR